jgi:hypothetical protein
VTEQPLETEVTSRDLTLPGSSQSRSFIFGGFPALCNLPRVSQSADVPLQLNSSPESQLVPLHVSTVVADAKGAAMRATMDRMDLIEDIVEFGL